MSNVTRPIIRGDDRAWKPPVIDPRPTPGQAAAAKRLCARWARDAADLRAILDALGIGRGM